MDKSRLSPSVLLPAPYLNTSLTLASVAPMRVYLRGCESRILLCIPLAINMFEQHARWSLCSCVGYLPVTPEPFVDAPRAQTFLAAGISNALCYPYVKFTRQRNLFPHPCLSSKSKISVRHPRMRITNMNLFPHPCLSSKSKISVRHPRMRITNMKLQQQHRKLMPSPFVFTMKPQK
jgi:hypothetical protein